MKVIYTIVLLFITLNAAAQVLSTTFEMRYFTGDPKANGETDFKGETEWMTTDQRIDFLEKYADYSSKYFNNSGLDKQIVTDEEIRSLVKKIKPQPLTNIRKTIVLNGWKSYGYKDGLDEQRKKEIESWKNFRGVSVTDGSLFMDNGAVNKMLDSISWKFRLDFKAGISENSTLTIQLSNAVALEIQKDMVRYAGRSYPLASSEGKDLMQFTIEGDMSEKKVNLLAGDRLIIDFSPMMAGAAIITDMNLNSKGSVTLDDIVLFNYLPGKDPNKPYYTNILIDESFDLKQDVTGWQKQDFDDSKWTQTDLPAVHGGMREKGEYFYLRKIVPAGDFTNATLLIETIDPGGEVWINNEVAAVINDRHPVDIDVTRYLKKNQDNLIAVKVRPFNHRHNMGHAPTDPYIGWFMGRSELVLTSGYLIKDVLVSTLNIGENAVQKHVINIDNKTMNNFEGTIEINYYPWFPQEGAKAASFKRDVRVRAEIINEYQLEVSIPDPLLWSSDSPILYRVEVILSDRDGKPVDDYMTTTGIRTVEQKNGDFLLNGKPEMLNGAQIMGFRTPIETIAKTVRCAPIESIAEEMLMIKKMNGNLLRMHVHAAGDTTDGINDPRYAEFADQMGIHLMWSTSGWTRTTEPWHVDFEGYPLYMKQVFNHPSITMWEASNHPTEFKSMDLSESNDYIKKIYHTIYQVDQSRLITPTTFWQHLHYGNYDGTLDYKGNPIVPCEEMMAPAVTRGSQDAYSGYGAAWTSIRNMPNKWAGSCLQSKEKAYFNFEHEESIGQPNWNLSKGKPWHLVMSYEWSYDEGSIGRKLSTDEWRASQAWQAFAAWESMKKQILIGYDGFSWCTLNGGANMGTYQKPLIDNERHPKLAYYTNMMVFQKTWAGSRNVDVVYGPEDKIIPVINHLGQGDTVNLLIELRNLNGKIMQKKEFKNISLQGGHSITDLESFRFRDVKDGHYVITYKLYN